VTTPSRDELIQEIMDTDESDTWQVDHLLDLGLSKKEVMALGFSDPLYRQRAKKRAKEGKPPPTTGSAGPSLFPAITKGTE